jgi:hypothetical protein
MDEEIGWVAGAFINTSNCTGIPLVGDTGTATPTPPPPTPGTGECSVNVLTLSEILSAVEIAQIGNGGTVSGTNYLIPGTQVVISAIHPNRLYGNVRYSDVSGERTGWIRIRDSVLDDDFSTKLEDDSSCLNRATIEGLVSSGNSLLPSCTSGQIYDCRPATCDLFCGTSSVSIVDFAAVNQGCTQDSCGTCPAWGSSSLSNRHCGVDYFVGNDNPRDDTADRSTYVAPVGGMYCGYGVNTHSLNTRVFVTDTELGGPGYTIWQYQFTHLEPFSTTRTRRYVDEGTPLGAYRLDQFSTRPHVQVAIVVYPDNGEEDLCLVSGPITYLDPLDPLSNILIPD